MSADLFLLRSSFKDLVRLRRLVLVALLALLPGVIALAWRMSGRPGEFKANVAYNTLEANLVFGFVLVILAVIFGTGALSQEIEQKTIVYLLARPLPRWRVLLVKYFAAVAAVTAALWLATLALGAGAFGLTGWSYTPIKHDLSILPVGALAYSALFLLLSTVIRRSMIAGLFFAFGWESWVAELPGNFQKASLMGYLHALAPHPLPQADSMQMAEVFTDSLSPATISHDLARTVLSLVTVVAVALALLIFTNGEYSSPEEV